jgi:hypothetical protein
VKKKKWIDASLKEVMDATKGGTCTLKRAIRPWKIFMSSFSNQFEQQDKI